VLELAAPLHEGGHVVAALLGHADVGQDDVWKLDRNAGNRLLAVVHGDDMDVFARERQLDDALNRDAVVGQQQLVHQSTFAVT
jgi:hypothetical protein